MTIDLEPEEVEILIEGLDYWKTKVAYVKGESYAEKTARLQQADTLEQKLRSSLPPA